MLKHAKNLRIGRFSQENQIYYTTFTTINRQPIFNSLLCSRQLINILKQSDTLQHTNTLAFVVMPDHIYWLFSLGNRHQLNTVIKIVKAKATLQIGYPVWQSGFYDHAIRKDEDIVNIARYIIANPIRAGLVKRVGDYPHWHAVWL